MDNDHLPFWLFDRYGHSSLEWHQLTEGQRAHWAREAKLVRRTIELGRSDGQSPS